MPNTLLPTYQTLLAHYGDPHWWSAKTPYEVMVGAILTQNTAWTNVEKAISNFGDALTPETVATMSMAELAEIIRPSGFFNAKAKYLKALTDWYKKYNYDASTVQRHPLNKVRAELLLQKALVTKLPIQFFSMRLISQLLWWMPTPIGFAFGIRLKRGRATWL